KNHLRRGITYKDDGCHGVLVPSHMFANLIPYLMKAAKERGCTIDFRNIELLENAKKEEHSILRRVLRQD
ncbi:OLC1v1000953C1, partial [Oldenlandia corymbosa var. corymbosa]